MSMFDAIFGDDNADHEECQRLLAEIHDLAQTTLQTYTEIPCVTEAYGPMAPARWLLVGEFMDGTGERYLIPFVPGGTELWDLLGQLEYTLKMVEQGLMVEVSQ